MSNASRLCSRSKGSLAYKMITRPLFFAHGAVLPLLHTEEIAHAMFMKSSPALEVTAALALNLSQMQFQPNEVPCILTTVIISLQAAQNLIRCARWPPYCSSLYVNTNHPRNSIRARGVRLRYPFKLFCSQPSSIKFLTIVSACVIRSDCVAPAWVCCVSAAWDCRRLVSPTRCNWTACIWVAAIPSHRIVLFVMNM